MVSFSNKVKSKENFASAVVNWKLTEEQRNMARVAGTTVLMMGAYLYLFDSTILGKLVSFLPGLHHDKEGGHGTLNLSITPSATSSLFNQSTYHNPVYDANSKLVGGGDAGFTFGSIFSILMIATGMVLITFSYDNPEQWQMPTCSLFYALSFVYLLSYIRTVREKGFNMNMDLLSLILFIVLLTTGVSLQAAIKREPFNNSEDEKKNIK